MVYDFSQQIETPASLYDVPPGLCPDKWRILDNLGKYFVWRYILLKNEQVAKGGNGAEAP